MFGGYVNVPHIFCYVLKGAFYDLEKGTIVSIIEVLKKQKKLVAKPTRSVGGGSGIHLVEYKDDNLFIDNKIVSEKAFINEVQKWEEYIFVQYITSANYSKKIYPNATNSIRIVSVHEENGDVNFLFAFHRFGSDL